MISPGADGEREEGELTEAAYANNPLEARMIQGLLESDGIPSLLWPASKDVPRVGGGGLKGGLGGDVGTGTGGGYASRGSRRVMVEVGRAEEARALLDKTLAENEEEAEPGIANARYLEDAAGRRPRGYGLGGAYARIYLWSFGVLALAFAVFLLLRAA